MEKKKIKLGDKVRDTITGFEGVAIGVHKWITGCKTISIQPQEMKDGKPIESKAFDAPRVELVAAKEKPFTKKDRKTGGPQINPVQHSDHV